MTKLNDQEDTNAKHDRDVRHVEDAGSQRPESNVDEIDNAAAGHAVDPVRRASRNEQTQPDQWPKAPAQPNRHDHQREQRKSGADREQTRAKHRRQLRAYPQEPTSILDVLEPKRIAQERSTRRSRQRRRRKVLRHPVTTNRRRNGDQQREPSSDSGNHRFNQPSEDDVHEVAKALSLRMRVTRPCLAPVLVVAVAGVCSAPAFGHQRSGEPAVTRVLFIGNSLTTTNNLPGIVETLARSTGDRIACRVVAFPDYSLEDHWHRGDARRAIAEREWSIVALQQGPSALPESRVLLREYTRRFDAEVRRRGARTALYMVWPSAARRGDVAGVSLSYVTAARDVKGLLFPVGEAWLAAWRRDSSLPLYGADGFHPSAMSSYLAALVIYQGVTGRSPIGLPADSLPASKALLLQEAAAEATTNLAPGDHGE